MTQLVLHGVEIATLFDLLGHDENHMTYALGCSLAQSPTLLGALLRDLDLEPVSQDETVIRLQQHEGLGGFTDIELRAGTLHAIIEAKRGWWLPSRSQLDKYEQRLQASGARQTRMVVLTQWGAESAAWHSIEQMGLSYRCDVVGWSDVLGTVRTARRSAPRAEHTWLDQLGRYLREVTDMRDTDSNSVYVVSLGHQRPDGWNYDFLDVVTKLGRYFFPANGKNWPKVPPNYIAFRYGGQLRSIHHVDDYIISTQIADVLPVAPTAWDPHFVLTLGLAIALSHVTPTGPRIRRAARV